MTYWACFYTNQRNIWFKDNIKLKGQVNLRTIVGVIPENNRGPSSSGNIIFFYEIFFFHLKIWEITSPWEKLIMYNHILYLMNMFMNEFKGLTIWNYSTQTFIQYRNKRCLFPSIFYDAIFKGLNASVFVTYSFILKHLSWK